MLFQVGSTITVSQTINTSAVGMEKKMIVELLDLDRHRRNNDLPIIVDTMKAPDVQTTAHVHQETPIE